jgi:hypothetical protein
MPPGASSGTARKGTGSQPRLRKITAPMRAERELSAAEMEVTIETVDGGRETIE